MRDLCTVTEMVTAAIPGTDGAAVVVPGPGGVPLVRAVQGDLPAALMDLQNDVGQGPWREAVTAASRIRIPDVRIESRWPLFCGRATTLGALSLLCTPMTPGTSVTGSLCLISRTAGIFDSQAGQLAAGFAEDASLALISTEITEQMREALNSRAIIRQAKAIMMERYQVTPEAAFSMLIRIALDTGAMLLDVAGEVCQAGVTGTSGPNAGQSWTPGSPSADPAGEAASRWPAADGWTRLTVPPRSTNLTRSASPRRATSARNSDSGDRNSA